MSTPSNPRRCPVCSSEIPVEAPQGLCPKCLLMGVASNAEPATVPSGKAADSRNDRRISRPDPPTVEQLSEAFPQLQIVELIGRGGMGFVYKAKQPKLDRFVALKILPGHLAEEPSFHERFEREARVLAKLQHPHIVSVYDFGESDPSLSGSFFYLVLEFIDGVNLREAMRAGRFTPEQALAIVPQVCEALQYAHSKGVLHRDIKPENILLDTEGRVKIADFGIAKVLVSESDLSSESFDSPGASESELAVTRLTATGSILGTPLYMAPEQLLNPNSVDHRADIYSLGVVFYEMLTGELPMGRFAAPSEKSLADQQIDRRIDEIVLRALAKEKELRQQSAGELKTEVETISTRPLPQRSSSASTGATPETSDPPLTSMKPGEPTLPGWLLTDIARVLLPLLVIAGLSFAIPVLLSAVLVPFVILDELVFGVITNVVSLYSSSAFEHELAKIVAIAGCVIIDAALLTFIWRRWLRHFSPRRAGEFVRWLLKPVAAAAPRSNDTPPHRPDAVRDGQNTDVPSLPSGAGGWRALAVLVIGTALAALPFVTFQVNSDNQSHPGMQVSHESARFTVLIGIPLMLLSVVVGVFIPIWLGWRHLIRQHHARTHGGIIPALIAAYFLPLALLDVALYLGITLPLDRHRDLQLVTSYIAAVLCVLVDAAVLIATWYWATGTPSGGRNRAGLPSTPVSSGTGALGRRSWGFGLLALSIMLAAGWGAYVQSENSRITHQWFREITSAQHEWQRANTDLNLIEAQRKRRLSLVDAADPLPMDADEAQRAARQAQRDQIDVELMNNTERSIALRLRIAELEGRMKVLSTAGNLRDGLTSFLPLVLFAIPLALTGLILLMGHQRLMSIIGMAIGSLAIAYVAARWNWQPTPSHDNSAALKVADEPKSESEPEKHELRGQIRGSTAEDPGQFPLNPQGFIDKSVQGVELDKSTARVEAAKLGLILVFDDSSGVRVAQQPIRLGGVADERLVEPHFSALVRLAQPTSQLQFSYRGSSDTHHWAKLLTEYPCDYLACDWSTGSDNPRILGYALPPGVYDFRSDPETNKRLSAAGSETRREFAVRTLKLGEQAVETSAATETDWHHAAGTAHVRFKFVPKSISKLNVPDECLVVLTDESRTMFTREGSRFNRQDLRTIEPIRQLRNAFVAAVTAEEVARVKDLLEQVRRSVDQQDWDAMLDCMTDDCRDEWMLELTECCQFFVAGKGRKQREIQLKQLRNSLSKHQIEPSPEEAKELQKQLDSYATMSAEQQRQFRVHVMRINYSDLQAVAKTILTFARQHARPALEISAVTDPSVEADSATATFLTRDGRRNPIVLRRIDVEGDARTWKIDSVVGASWTLASGGAIESIARYRVFGLPCVSLVDLDEANEPADAIQPENVLAPNDR